MDIARLIRHLPRWMRGRNTLVRALVRVAPGSRVQLVRFNGTARLFADLSDGFSRAYFLSGSYDPEFFTIAMPFVQAGDVVFDVGANMGFCTFGLIQALGARSATYHLFEAQPELCALLQRSAALYPSARVWVNHACVSAAPGASRLRIMAGDLGTSRVAVDGATTVANLLLDQYVVQQGIDRVAFVKLDIEGSEPLALAGARQALRRGVFEAIFFELSSVTLGRAGFRVEDCLSPLREAGFELYYVRAVDVNARQRRGEPVIYLDLHGHRLRLSAVGKVAGHVHTDLLALSPRTLARLRAS